jgi:hypothetical protein
MKKSFLAILIPIFLMGCGQDPRRNEIHELSFTVSRNDDNFTVNALVTTRITSETADTDEHSANTISMPQVKGVYGKEFKVRIGSINNTGEYFQLKGLIQRGNGLEYVTLESNSPF